MSSSGIEAVREEIQAEHHSNIVSATEKRDQLMIEAAFYTNPEWERYEKEVLTPRYRNICDLLVDEEETAKMLRLQGEARAIRYQILRSVSILQDLEDAKEELQDIQESPPTFPIL